MSFKNGYLDSFVGDERISKNRRSGFMDDDDDDDDDDEGSSSENNSKINTLNINNEKTYTKKMTKQSDSFNKNEFICIINILASTLGGGCFCFAYILYQVGLINSILILIFVSLSCYYSLDLLRRFVVDARLFSFAIITHTTLGNFWFKVYVIASFFFYLSIIVNYSKLLYMVMESMLFFLENDIAKIFYFLLLCVIEIIFCIFANTVSKLFILSIIVVICYGIIFLTVIIKSLVFMITQGVGDKFYVENLFIAKNLNKESNWYMFLMIMSKFIEFFYGYTYHSSYPTMLSDLENISHESTQNIHAISFSVIAILYLFIGFFGYLIAKDVPKFLFISEENFKNNNFLICLFKVILAIFFLLLIPVRYVVIRDNYTSLFSVENLQKKYEIIIITVCLFLVNLIVYFVHDDSEGEFNLVSMMTQIFGGFLGVLICFVLPVINFVAIDGKLKLRALIGFIICFIFVVIGFFSIFNNIHNISTGKKSDQIPEYE